MNEEQGGYQYLTGFDRHQYDWSSADAWEKGIQDEKDEKLKKEQWRKIIKMLSSGGGISGLVVTSKLADGVSRLKQFIDKGLDGFYTANFNAQGNLSLSKTSQDGKMTKQQKAFLKILNTVINSSNPTFIEIVDGDSNVEIGQWSTGKIDIGDIGILGSSDLRLPQFFSAQGAVAHEFYEQYQRQGLGKTNGEKEHSKTILAVDNKVNSSTRVELGSFQIQNHTGPNDEAIRNRVTLSTGVSRVLDLIFLNGNLDQIK